MSESFLFGPEPQTERATVYDIPATREDYLSAIYEQSASETPSELLGSFLSKPKSGGMRYTKDEAHALAKDYGVDMVIPDDGIDYDNFKYNLARQKQRMERQQVIDRQPDGFTTSVLGFGAMLAPQVVDPINIATGMIPLVGPSRYSALLASTSSRAGRAALRAGVAGGEAAVGTAIVEPLNYNMARALGDDYTAYDSFMNIAFGLGFGSAIGAGGGLVADAFGKGRGAIQSVPREVHAGIIQAVANKMIMGSSIDAGPLLNAAVRRNLLYDLNEVSAIPGLGKRVSSENKYDIAYGRAAEDVAGKGSDTQIRITNLEKELTTQQKLNQYERALNEYDAVFSMEARTPTEELVKQRKVDDLTSRYGDDFESEARHYLSYKDIADELVGETKPKKIKDLKKRLKEMDAKFDGRLSKAYDQKNIIDRAAVEKELGMLKADQVASIKQHMKNMENAAALDYIKVADDFSRGFDNLEAVKAAQELVPVEQEIKSIKPDTMESKSKDLDEEINFYKEMDKEFDERYPDVRFDEIDDADFDVSETLAAARNYAKCLMR